MRSLLAVAVAVLWCNNVESAVQDCASSTPAFVNGAICGQQMSRKRPRGAPGVAAAAAGVVQASAMTGSFTAERLACGERTWFGAAGEGRRRGTRGESRRLLMQLELGGGVLICAGSLHRTRFASDTRYTPEASGPPHASFALRVEPCVAASLHPVCVLFPCLATCHAARHFFVEGSLPPPPKLKIELGVHVPTAVHADAFEHAAA